MNKVILCGRLTKDPETRQTADGGTQFSRYTLAVDRRGKDKEADFINCVAFGKGSEFADKYLHKGSKVIVSGRIQTGSYTNRDGQKVYTTEVMVDEHEFAESRQSAQNATDVKPAEESNRTQENGFYEVSDEGLPFN